MLFLYLNVILEKSLEKWGEKILVQKCIVAIDNYFWSPEDDPKDKVSFYKVALSVNAISILMLILILLKIN